MRSALIGVSLGVAAPAFGQATPQGYDVDVEFFRPSFGHGAFTGVDVPMTKGASAFRYGVMMQYLDDPLTVYDAVADQETASVVVNRLDTQLGVSVDLSDRFSLGLRLPMAYNGGSEIAEFAALGYGLGDIGARSRLVIVKTRRDLFNLGARVGLQLPTGRRNFYVSERGIRADAGLMAVTNLGPVRIAADSGILMRRNLSTDEDFILDDEIIAGVGGRYALPAATRLALTTQVLTRGGLANFLNGGAENGLEWVGGMQYMLSKSATIDVGAGRGFNEGYGTTDLRVQSALVIQHAPRPEPELVIEEGPPPPPPPPPPVIEELPEPEPEWQEDEVARVVADKIQIKEQLKFIVDTNILLDESRPTLLGVADIINTSPSIGHVVIEGHASQEGGFEYNYKLSESRARAIFEELFQAGVHPSRISYRSMGEVVPLVEGEDEESLAQNRRVEFNIVKQYESVEDMPNYAPSHPLPWSGEVVPIRVPAKPEPPAEEVDKGPELDEFGLPTGDMEDEFEMDEDQGGTTEGAE